LLLLLLQLLLLQLLLQSHAHQLLVVGLMILPELPLLEQLLRLLELLLLRLGGEWLGLDAAGQPFKQRSARAGAQRGCFCGHGRSYRRRICAPVRRRLVAGERERGRERAHERARGKCSAGAGTTRRVLSAWVGRTRVPAAHDRLRLRRQVAALDNTLAYRRVLYAKVAQAEGTLVAAAHRAAAPTTVA
jgi:hypothetical protein